jgi:hypothetical protein
MRRNNSWVKVVKLDIVFQILNPTCFPNLFIRAIRGFICVYSCL